MIWSLPTFLSFFCFSCFFLYFGPFASLPPFLESSHRFLCRVFPLRPQRQGGARGRGRAGEGPGPARTSAGKLFFCGSESCSARVRLRAVLPLGGSPPRAHQALNGSPSPPPQLFHLQTTWLLPRVTDWGLPSAHPWPRLGCRSSPPSRRMDSALVHVMPPPLPQAPSPPRAANSRAAHATKGWWKSLGPEAHCSDPWHSPGVSVQPGPGLVGARGKRITNHAPASCSRTGDREHDLSG